jgi:hypothetical protein
MGRQDQPSAQTRTLRWVSESQRVLIGIDSRSPVTRSTAVVCETPAWWMPPWTRTIRSP